MNHHFHKKVWTIFLVSLLFSVTQAWCQEEVAELRLIGYQNQDPVFLLKESNAGEVGMMKSTEAVEEASEVIEEAEVVGEVSSSGVNLWRLNNSTGETEPLSVVEELEDVLGYANGKVVGVSQYGLEVAVDGTLIDIQLQEEYFDDSDFRSDVLEMAERFNIVNVAFSPDGEQLHYPVYNRLKIRSYTFATESFSEMDFSEIDDYGGAILMPAETLDYVYFLARLNGPYELFQMNKSTDELKKAPFTLSRRGGFGLKYHPVKDQVLFIYDNVPLAYSFSLGKFQKLEIPENPVAREEGLESDFKKIYYAHGQQEWRYATLEGDQLVSKPLAISDEDDSFNLAWIEAEELIEEERIKNLSPEEELTMSLKKIAQLPRPFSYEVKAGINNVLLQFNEKYQNKASDPKVQQALITSRAIGLDTSLVSEEVVASNQEYLMDLIKRDQLNYNPLLGLRLIGRVATVQPPVHPARVAILEALVSDHLEENDINSGEALDASGLGLLLIALKANKQYEEAIGYTQQMLKYIEQYNLPGKREAYESIIYLQISAKQYQEALKSIDTYQTELDPNGNYLDKDIGAEIKKAHAYAGMKDFDQAFKILDTQSQRFKESEEEIFGSETKAWLGFLLRYAYAEIHFMKGSKQKDEQLTTLLTYVSDNASSFQYKKMYAETVELLDEIGQTDKAKELPRP